MNGNTHSLYQFERYSSFSRYRTDRVGGGVSILVKQGIAYKPRDDLSTVNNRIECVFIEIDKTVFSKSKNILIGVIYRPPDTNLDLFTEIFIELMAQIILRSIVVSCLEILI